MAVGLLICVIERFWWNMMFVQRFLWLLVSSHAHGHSQVTSEEMGERHRIYTEIPTVTWHTQPPLMLWRCSTVRLKAGGAVLPCPSLSWVSQASERQGNISKLNEVSQEDGKFLWQSGERESENERGRRKKRAERESSEIWEQSLPLRNVGLLSNIWTVIFQIQFRFVLRFLSFCWVGGIVNVLQKSEEWRTAVSKIETGRIFLLQRRAYRTTVWTANSECLSHSLHAL